MVLSLFQRDVCRLLARNRVASGESYLAGGATLNELLAAPRLSRDLDVFHDTEEALAVSWQADRAPLIEAAGYAVRVFRERAGLVEAEVRRGAEAVRMEWARDSAYRFFPLVEHPDLGLTLHPFDLGDGQGARAGRPGRSARLRRHPDVPSTRSSPWATWRGPRAARTRASALRASSRKRPAPPATRRRSSRHSTSLATRPTRPNRRTHGTSSYSRRARSSPCCPPRKRAARSSTPVDVSFEAIPQPFGRPFSNAR